MRKVSLKTAYCLAILLFLAVVGCNKDPKNPERNKLNGKIGVKFVTPVNQKKSIKSVTNQNEEIKGMYFRQVSVTAFQYSPDYGFDEGRYFYNSGYGDWAHYVVINHITSKDKAANIILLNGGEVDMEALNVEPYSLSENYLSKYDHFSVDFLAIHSAVPGVFFNDTFYGHLNYWGTSDWDEIVNAVRADYPELGDFSLYSWKDRWGADYLYEPAMEGFSKFDLHFTVIFARADWFSESVFVRIDDSETNSGSGEIDFSFNWSSKPLTNHQKELLISLINHHATTQVAGIANTCIMIVPYNGPAKLALYDDAEGMQNPEFKVSFDFTKLLTDETYHNIISGGLFRRASAIDNPDPAFTFKSSNSIPFGISTSIGEKE